ncbi:hypothetical protein PIB30_098403 [Stylosanthes scabra]|uniref:Uncharacterized protein n=1 Tax=Stylosanthes scabra TaxID=79078 RepID=A0ABU6UWT5_9FABA|nr:hypothetical protein [Stylosanthes scabra]
MSSYSAVTISPLPEAKCTLEKLAPFRRRQGEMVMSPKPEASWLWYYLIRYTCRIVANRKDLPHHQLQDVGGSSSSSNHVESGQGININGGAHMPANRRASSSSPSFSPYVNRPVPHPPLEVSHFEDHAGAFTIHSLEMDDAQEGVLTVTVVMMMNLFRRHSYLLLNRSWGCQPLQLH